MKNYALHIPEGVKDYSGEEAALKEKIQSQVKKVFITHSYNLIETPTFEYLDVFTIGEGSFQKPSLYNLVSRQGEVMALRSDMTRAIARVVCTQKSKHYLPKRYAYVTNSFRYPERYRGQLHEFTQAGVELIGKNSLEADAEVIKLAISSLKKIGLSDFTVHIGSSQFLEYTLSSLGLDEESKTAIYEAIEVKNMVQLKMILQNSNIDTEMLNLLLELTQCAGQIELLRNVKRKISDTKVLLALDELETLYEILVDYGVNDYVLFDFSILSFGKYYTGMMFQIFTYGIGSALVEGGRYDNLILQFGTDLPAVGFGMNINLVMQHLMQKQGLEDLQKRRTLVVSNDLTRKACIEVSGALRSQGLVIENSLTSHLEEALNYAKERGIGGLLHFKSGDQVSVYNLQDGTVQETTINEL